MADVISNDPKLTKEKDKKTEEEKNELCEEDKLLQDELNLLVERLVENDISMHPAALASLREHIRASTTSMTSVPKPLKFMRVHYDTMKGVYEKMELPETKKACADIVSVLAMTMSEGRDCLKYRLKGSQGDIGLWGHEYVRQLAGEIAAEWAELVPEDTEMKTQLLDLAREIVPYNMAHNAEAETCDLLMEIERLDLLEQYVDESAYPRVCLYLTSCVPYVPDPENTTLLQCALRLFKRFGQYPQALVLAMQLNDMKLIENVFTSCKDLDLQLDIMEPKTPEDVYKSHLENSRPSYGGGQIDSARQNLAASFVNGFVNAAFERDKVLMEDGNKWLYKNKDH
ncbi:hypothetical protein J437_LFUL017408, partial [Ladona fulva]